MSEEKYPLLARSGESIVVVLGHRDGTFPRGAYPCYAARYYKSLGKWDERFRTDSRLTDYKIHDGPLPEGCPPLPCAVTNPPPERFQPGVYTSNSGDPVIATKEFSGLHWLLFGRWEAGDWSLNDPWRKPLGDNHLRYLTPDQFAECVASGALDAETQARWKALHDPPKPTYRAYAGREELPWPWPLLRYTNNDGADWLSVRRVTETGVSCAGMTETWHTLFKDFTQSTDGGKTWQPAGLAE